MMEYNRHNDMIATHKYSFNQRELDVEALKSLTLPDFQAFFEKIFFSDFTKRLDLELTSEAHKEEQNEERKPGRTQLDFESFKKLEKSKDYYKENFMSRK